MERPFLHLHQGADRLVPAGITAPSMLVPDDLEILRTK